MTDFDALAQRAVRQGILHFDQMRAFCYSIPHPITSEGAAPFFSASEACKDGRVVYAAIQAAAKIREKDMYSGISWLRLSDPVSALDEALLVLEKNND